MSILLEDLDSTILSHCDLEDDFLNIIVVNRHYCKLVNDDKLFLEWKRFNSTNKFPIKNIDHKFQLSCWYGCIIYSKYLLDKHRTINIHADNENAFISSCSNGYIDVAKWLIELRKKN